MKRVESRKSSDSERNMIRYKRAALMQTYAGLWCNGGISAF